MSHHWHPLRIIGTDLLRPLSSLSEPITRRLAAGMAAAGIQKNPIAVASVGSSEFIILDGVARWSALKRLGIRDALTQVVDLDDPLSKLSSWNHVVRHLTARELENMASKLKLTLSTAEETVSIHDRHIGADTLVALLGDDKTYRIEFDRSDLISFNQTLSRLITAYSANSQVIRLPSESLIDGSLISRTGGEAHITLPVYTQSEVSHLMKSGYLLPPHTLCYSFPCRYLGIRISLDILSQDVPSDDKNGFLDELIRMRLSRSRAAYYPQSVFLMND
ncbi:MAG: ParB N-terminal domain-containing protein [candidate division Zixibacteria bacterium]|nr:ParB N-terminal domain-containing protein [candidate division Zixibacteria bacterium]MBU1471688.1 ParB N-terminal domain-containing protein [candidate division Zixibacteria bacterium]MBU2625416.1 ParB N-terminal domain-containing protein [candidate division Zixibacteria bacterium]